MNEMLNEKDREQVESMIAGVMKNVGPLLEQLVNRVNYSSQGVRTCEEGMVQLAQEIDVLRRQNARMQEDIDMLMRDAVCNRAQPVNSPWGKINTDQECLQS